MNYNPCIYTGALVVLREYPAYIRCDIFYIGDCLLFLGFDRLHHFGLEEAREVLYREVDAFVPADDSLMKETSGVIATPRSKVDWTDKGYDKVRDKLAHDGVKS